AWKAQQRLHKRYQAMAARGKNKNQIVAALGRELLGFIWAIGAVPAGWQLRRAAPAGTLDGPRVKKKAGFPPAEESRPENQTKSLKSRGT
ncbi:MAG: hypothetical protein ACM3ZB_11685, partial [bacterium]